MGELLTILAHLDAQAGGEGVSGHLPIVIECGPPGAPPYLVEKLEPFVLVTRGGYEVDPAQSIYALALTIRTLLALAQRPAGDGR